MAEATHIAPNLSTQGKSQKNLCVTPWACYLVPSHNLSHFSLPKKAFWVKQRKRDNVYKEITAETFCLKNEQSFSDLLWLFSKSTSYLF